MLKPDDEQRIDAFFSEISPWMRAYRNQTLCYVGIEVGNVTLVCAARVRLSPIRPPKDSIYRAGTCVAGRLSLKRLGLSPVELAKRVASGDSIAAPGGQTLTLPAGESVAMWVPPPTSFHSEGLSSGRRLSVLSIYGGNRPPELSQPEIDWELKAARTPFDSLSELLVAYELGAQLGDRCFFQVIAHTAVEVLAESSVDGDTANIGLWLPTSLKKSDSRLSYRIMEKGTVTKRGSIPGSKMRWERRDLAFAGTIKIDVPRAAIINCTAVYADQAHHTSWVADVREFQNPRMSAFETIDRGMEVLKEFLLPSSLKGAVARQFELAVGWILWAYGLSVAHMDSADQSRDGPDLLAVAPSGGFAVVECTVGLLKAENKLAKVARRAIAIRERLEAAGFRQARVLAAIVTTLRRQEVVNEIDSATDAGVLVLTRENLEAAVNEILLFPDGDRFFQRELDAFERQQAELRMRRESRDVNA